MRVTVVGAGVIGLTTSMRLIEAGHEVTVISAEPPERTTSWLAAAVWFPTHVGPPELVGPAGRRTFDVQAQEAADGVPGVIMRESLMLGASTQGDWQQAVGAVRPATPDELPPGYREGVRFVVPLVEIPRYLPWLYERVQAQAVATIHRRIENLVELDGTDAVVNCTGLAARELAADDSVYPVRGQIVRVTNPGLTMSVRDEHHPAGRAYVHPRVDDAILGGTLEVGRWDLEPDPDVAASILSRCRDLAPELADANVIEHIVGLRPARPAVRLEEDQALPGGSRLLHNYGHGGAGITLGWGCAEEITRLLAA